MAHREKVVDIIVLGTCEVPYTNGQNSSCTIISLYESGAS